MKKKILLFGFNNKQIIFLKNKFKNKINFITQNKLKYNITLQIDAIIGITRRGFLDFLKKILIQKKIKPHWIHLPGAGVEEYTIFKNLDINFSNGKIIQGVQVSEHAIALLLSLTRNLVPILKKGTNVKFERRPIEIKGKKALIYGYGGIGRLLAEKLNSFGVEVSAVNRNYVPIDSNISKLYMDHDSTKAIKKKDFLFITSPLTSENLKIFNYSKLKLLNKNSIVINVSRGKLLCLESLYKCLKEKIIFGAGLDVSDPEPLLKNHKLYKFKNFIYSPHIAGISDNFSERNFGLIMKNLNRFIKNKSLINKISLKEGY
tara:strand:- start:4292 stop:5245 length:954 start_codon:yes stop_codon:yes gene_type:complete